MRYTNTSWLLYTLLIVAGLAKTGQAATDTPVTHIQTENSLQITIPAPQVIPGITNPPLHGIFLNLGENIHLDRPFVATEQAAEGCILKSDIKARFCIDPVAWPETLLGDMASDDIVYRGNQAIVRYDDNRVTQAHILFPADRFIRVLEHIEALYGPPTEQQLLKTLVPEADPIINTVVRWKSVFDGDKRDLILEVRAHDDTRRTFPDNTHGFMWLYRTGAEPVFHLLSVVDLMVLRKRRIGQWPYPDQSEIDPAIKSEIH
ncbi:MAG: hypothetical protein HQ483_20005 [Rhodospirillales bacterium]|nr:hypothetical protein [Rhodospirillales bacterium]